MMTTPVAAGKGVAGITGETASRIGSDFMTLLVAELKTQDPLDPMDGGEFMAQLVQLQSLAELTQMRQALANGAGAGTLGSMVGLVGRRVEWLDAATGDRFAGVVSRVELRRDGGCVLVVGGEQVDLRQVVAVS